MIKHEFRNFLVSLVSVSFVAIVFFFERNTTAPYSIYPLYFPSIMIVAWYSGRTASMLMTVLCTLAWFIAWQGYYAEMPRTVLFWNTSIRFLTFCFVVWLVMGLKSKNDYLMILRERLQELLEREKKYSRIDPLTGASNIRAFNERLNYERARSKRQEGYCGALLYIDIDSFKEINDSSGHQYGDEILRSFTSAVKDVIREVDFIARMGGDEFAVLLHQADSEGVRVCAHRIIRVLQARLAEPINVSIGGIIFNKFPDSNEQMIWIADKAMYRAKNAGGGQFTIAEYDEIEKSYPF